MRIERRGLLPHSEAAAASACYDPRSGVPRFARRRRAGFSLVELLVVVAIIGLLASIVALNLGGASAKARKEKAVADMKVINNAIILYKEDCGVLPRSVSDLVEDSGETGWGRGTGGESYLDERPVDPWGNDYILHVPDPISNRKYNIQCLGARGQDGGDGDEADIWAYEAR